jgi:succinate dehydrogenase / fumarate reductase iron-sulfur subunit
MAFVNNIERNGLLHEADLLPDSYGGKFHPRAVPELLSSLPVVLRALQRGKVTPGGALLHKHKAPKEVKRIFRDIHDREERYELNLYVVGEEDEPETGGAESQADAAGSQLPAERSPNK